MTDAVDNPHDPGDPRSTAGHDPATGEQAETPDLAVIAGEVLATGSRSSGLQGLMVQQRLAIAIGSVQRRLIELFEVQVSYGS